MNLSFLTCVRHKQRTARQPVLFLIRVVVSGLALITGFAFQSHSLFAQTTRVKIGLPDFSISFLSVKVAQSQGFFLGEGLEPELIRISNPVAMIALMNKEIDYALSTGSVLASAVRGLPLKVVMYSLRTPVHALMVKPAMKSFADLKGKVFGVATGTTDAILRAMMVHGKLTEKDVKILLISESSSRLNALATGRIDGAILPPPFSVQAEKLGLRRLIGAAEVPEIVDGRIAFPPPAGVGIHQDKLQNQPQQLKQIVRAMLKAHDFVRNRKNDTIKLISDWLKVDASIAAGSYDAYAGSLSPQGFVPNGVMEAVIEQQSQLLKISEPPPPTKVVDFRTVKETADELYRGR